MVYAMSGRAVRHVFVHGRCVVRDGRLTGIDEARLVREVGEHTRRLFSA
jgi:cytosine/adenosine deaminase-related metal-dependent hydrolase